MRKGKFASDRDSALYLLCDYGWANDSTGDSLEWNCYAWRISNNWEDVQPINTEFTSLIEEWFEAEDVEDSPRFRRSLVGHFIVMEMPSGIVSVLEYGTEAELLKAFREIEAEYSAWLEYRDGPEGTDYYATHFTDQ